MIGRTLAHYRITAKLGEGGMGEVYLATDTKLGREIALKILPQAMSSNPDRLRRFQREARAVAALNHPNIVTIHSVEEDEAVHFITMERVAGKPLDESSEPSKVPVADLIAVFTALRTEQLVEVAIWIAPAQEV